MPDVSLRPLIFAMALIVWVLAWEGNFGKGLACLISPKSLEVIGGGNTTGSSTTTA